MYYILYNHQSFSQHIPFLLIVGSKIEELGLSCWAQYTNYKDAKESARKCGYYWSDVEIRQEIRLDNNIIDLIKINNDRLLYLL